MFINIASGGRKSDFDREVDGEGVSYQFTITLDNIVIVIVFSYLLIEGTSPACDYATYIHLCCIADVLIFSLAYFTNTIISIHISSRHAGPGQ